MNVPMETIRPAVTNEQPVLIRLSRDSDVEAMLAIYRHHIRRGIEDSVDDSGTPEPDDLLDRRKNLRNTRLPHLVATCGGEVVGYAYVVLFRKRTAYRHTVKHSIYVHREYLGHGQVSRARLLLETPRQTQHDDGISAGRKPYSGEQLALEWMPFRESENENRRFDQNGQQVAERKEEPEIVRGHEAVSSRQKAQSATLLLSAFCFLRFQIILIKNGASASTCAMATAK